MVGSCVQRDCPSTARRPSPQDEGCAKPTAVFLIQRKLGTRELAGGLPKSAAERVLFGRRTIG
jgi:hypothetical protein